MSNELAFAELLKEELKPLEVTIAYNNRLHEVQYRSGNYLFRLVLMNSAQASFSSLVWKSVARAGHIFFVGMIYDGSRHAICIDASAREIKTIASEFAKLIQNPEYYLVLHRYASFLLDRLKRADTKETFLEIVAKIWAAQIEFSYKVLRTDHMAIIARQKYGMSSFEFALMIERLTWSLAAAKMLSS